MKDTASDAKNKVQNEIKFSALVLSILNCFELKICLHVCFILVEVFLELNLKQKVRTVFMIPAKQTMTQSNMLVGVKKMSKFLKCK